MVYTGRRIAPDSLRLASATLRKCTQVVQDQVRRIAASKWQIVCGLYGWALWGFVLLLVFAQFLGIFWDSTTTTTHVVYGQNPLLGPYAASGTNDEPYSDRMVVCVRRGRLYKPAQLS